YGQHTDGPYGGSPTTSTASSPLLVLPALLRITGTPCLDVQQHRKTAARSFRRAAPRPERRLPPHRVMTHTTSGTSRLPGTTGPHESDHESLRCGGERRQDVGAWSGIHRQRDER